MVFFVVNYRGLSSIQKQVRLPPLIQRADEVSDKRNVVRTHWLAQQRHVRFFRSPVSLPVIALHARGNKIFPRIFPRSRNRHHVVNRQRNVSAPAELASMTVATEDILS